MSSKLVYYAKKADAISYWKQQSINQESKLYLFQETN